MNRFLVIPAATLLLASVMSETRAMGQPVATAAEVVAIKAAKVHVGNGRTMKNCVILIQDGRIQAIGPKLAIPERAKVIEVDGGCLTPGLIDANARLEAANLIPDSHSKSSHGESSHGDSSHEGHGHAVHVDRYRDAEPSCIGLPGHGHTTHDKWPPQGGDQRGDDTHVGDDEIDDTSGLSVGVGPSAVISEQSSEVVPHTRVLDSLNLRSGDFDRLVRGGVTTVYASADSSAVIGPRGAVLHTAGPRDRRVLQPVAAVKATIGSEPSMVGSYNSRPYRDRVSMYARRPNSRMGLTWVFRKAFYDAIRRGEGPGSQGRGAYGADTSSPEASAVLREVLDENVSLRIQARLQQDIHTAIRLAEEFDLDFTLEEATEAYRCIDSIKAANVPVIFGPIYARPNGLRSRTGEANQSRYHTFAALLDAGIPTALSAGDLREEDGLARQVMAAMRFGVSFDDALRAVTETPARLLGLEKELGTIEHGKRADLVLWSGRPFAATSMPLVVLVDGNIVVDRRQDKTDNQ